VVVLAVQFGGVCGAKPSGDEDTHGACPVSGPNGRLSDSSAGPSRQLRSGEDAPRPWPKLELPEVSSYDPFALRTPVAASPEPNPTTPQAEAHRAEQDGFLEQLQEQGVQAVVGGGNRNAAVIGSQVVRVGDLLGQFRVVGIDADGVVLERSAPE
jgi:hypothetical protein